MKILFRVLCAAQECTLNITKISEDYHFSLVDGSCQNNKDTQKGVFSLDPGTNCNFVCAEGYYASNGNAILFACNDDAAANALAPCASA